MNPRNMIVINREASDDDTQHSFLAKCDTPIEDKETLLKELETFIYKDRITTVQKITSLLWRIITNK